MMRARLIGALLTTAIILSACVQGSSSGSTQAEGLSTTTNGQTTSTGDRSTTSAPASTSQPIPTTSSVTTAPPSEPSTTTSPVATTVTLEPADPLAFDDATIAAAIAAVEGTPPHERPPIANERSAEIVRAALISDGIDLSGMEVSVWSFTAEGTLLVLEMNESTSATSPILQMTMIGGPPTSSSRSTPTPGRV